MGFQFSLATVLQVRGIQEEREERMLQQILFELSRAQEALTQIEADIEGADASRVAEVLKPVLGRNVHVSYGEMTQLKQTRKECLERIVKLKDLRDRQVKVYEAARRNREMLSDMRDKQRSAYDSEVARSEQKTLDDNFIARRLRN